MKGVLYVFLEGCNQTLDLNGFWTRYCLQMGICESKKLKMWGASYLRFRNLTWPQQAADKARNPFILRNTLGPVSSAFATRRCHGSRVLRGKNPVNQN